MSRGLTFALTELPEAMRKQAQEKLAAAGTTRAHVCEDEVNPRLGKTKKLPVVYVEFNGEKHSLAEWEKRTGISQRTLRYRLKHGWPTANLLKKRGTTAQIPKLNSAEERLALHLRVEGLGGFVREYRFSQKRFWRFDFAHIPSKLAVEIDGGVHSGGRHVRGKGYENDAEKRNAAVMAGWRVLHFLPHQVKSGRAIREIKRALEGFRT